MTHVLITFLGRTKRKENGYPKALYRFPDATAREAAFVGFPLAQWLGADRLVVLGTSGSMWDHLFEAGHAVTGHEDERLALVDAVDHRLVEQPQLDCLAPVLTGALECEVILRMIPAALDEREQVTVLSALAEATEGADALSLDVTHGYRHLPMLALTAALYLRGLRPQLGIHGLWYGAFDPESRQAQLVNLAGLLEISGWVAAWQRFEAIGDYGAISPLVRNHDPELADALQQGTYLESIHQGQQARALLREARRRLLRQPLQGAGGLFQPALDASTAWVDGQRLYLRQRDHAFAALRRDDFLRACLYGFEAFITKLTQDQAPAGQENDINVREAARKSFQEDQPPRLWPHYRFLRDLRNVLAHGNQARLAEVQKALQSSTALRPAIRTALDALLHLEGS